MSDSVYEQIQDDCKYLGLDLGAQEMAQLAEKFDMSEESIQASAEIFRYLKQKKSDNIVSTLLRLSRLPLKEVLCELLDTKPEQIGTVGIINLLYFLSKGKYPIYDQFADRALTAIIEGKKPGDLVSVTAKLPDKNSSKSETFAERLMNPDGDYMQYKARIEQVFGDYEQSYRWNRDVDRALWVYGHLFSTDADTKTRC